MADTKITALTAIGANPIIPATFPIPMVDLTDTSMAASGTTKKVTVNQILGAGGTATLASATISGDLTVDTSTLKVDSTNNRVGIGTASPALPLEIYKASGDSKMRITSGSNTLTFGWDDPNGFYYTASTSLMAWQLSGSTAMTLNASGLGVGVASPAYKLDVRTAPATAAIEGLRVSDATRMMISGQTGATYSYIGIGGNQNVIYSSNSRLDIAADGQSIFLRSSAANYLNLDASGNVGIGVTPSAWSSSFKAIQFAANGSLAGQGTNTIVLSSNSFINSGSVYKYLVSSRAANYAQAAGSHIWSYDSGTQTAGADVNFVAAMTLDASGNLILLSSNTPATLTTNGQLTVNATSNTNLRFSYRGSDGVTRTANLTLA